MAGTGSCVWVSDSTKRRLRAAKLSLQMSEDGWLTYDALINRLLDLKERRKRR